MCGVCEKSIDEVALTSIDIDKIDSYYESIVDIDSNSDGEDDDVGSDYFDNITMSDDDDSTNAPPLLACDVAARENEMESIESDDECEYKFDVNTCEYVEIINSGDVCSDFDEN